MIPMTKLLLVQAGFVFAFLLLGWGLVAVFGLLGAVIHSCLFMLWCWQFFAFVHYRFCRQEEFLHILRTAAATQAPVEALIHAYLAGRPNEHLFRGGLLFFVFPGYYWFHLQRSFDARLAWLAHLLDEGVPLGVALGLVPGVMLRESAMAVVVGEFSGQLPHALHRLPERRLANLWLHLSFRLAYPLLLLLTMVSIMSFILIFIIPKFEKIFDDFRMKLPYITEVLVAASRWVARAGWFLLMLVFLFVVLFNSLVLSSRAKWSFPLVGWVYRLYARGQFLQVLGLMLESSKPLPAILDCLLESRLLPTALQTRVDRLTADLRQGQPLAECLARHQLATASTRGLIASAEKAQNLPWALQALGDSMIRRSARLTLAISTVLFPLAIFACACLIGVVAIALFSPLVTLIESIQI